MPNWSYWISATVNPDGDCGVLTRHPAEADHLAIMPQNPQ